MSLNRYIVIWFHYYNICVYVFKLQYLKSVIFSIIFYFSLWAVTYDKSLNTNVLYIIYVIIIYEYNHSVHCTHESSNVCTIMVKYSMSVDVHGQAMVKRWSKHDLYNTKHYRHKYIYNNEFDDITVRQDSIQSNIMHISILQF